MRHRFVQWHSFVTDMYSSERCSTFNVCLKKKKFWRLRQTAFDFPAQSVCLPAWLLLCRKGMLWDTLLQGCEVCSVKYGLWSSMLWGVCSHNGWEIQKPCRVPLPVISQLQPPFVLGPLTVQASHEQDTNMNTNTQSLMLTVVSQGMLFYLEVCDKKNKLEITHTELVWNSPLVHSAHTRTHTNDPAKGREPGWIQ